VGISSRLWRRLPRQFYLGTDGTRSFVHSSSRPLGLSHTQESETSLFVLRLGLYLIALVVNIAIVFGTIRDQLDSRKFLGPNLLKGDFCLTPLLLPLLLHHADDLQGPAKRKDLVSKLSYQMAIELFDVVDMIEIVLDHNGHGKETLSTKSFVGVCQPCLCKRYPEHISCATVSTDEPRSFNNTSYYRNNNGSSSMSQSPTSYRSIGRKQAFA